MFTFNPFAALPAWITPAAMQVYVVVMFLAVVVGTVADMLHKKSATYFFKHRETVARRATREVTGGEKIAFAIHTVVVTGLAAGEFHTSARRISHLLTMYGFIFYVVTTALLVLAYPTTSTAAPAIVTGLWYLGAALICVGGYWFWFTMRVDVAAEGHSPFRLVRADLFIVSLLASATFALVWARLEALDVAVWGHVCFALYLLATTVLFGSVPWSKFAHMFYKPAAAFQKRIEQANGYRRNLPAPADRPATLGTARRPPRHY
ncbi:MAG: adenylyl-sulfate reductase [Gammaproteobacteria bacterium]|nr:adenylyl-sulfate reductase [Gammaproteobacteria bacterium]